MKPTRSDQRSLGRGLSALLADLDTDEAPEEQTIRRVAIESIVPNPDQPRRHYDPDALAELSKSLRAQGVLQPLIVRPHPDGGDLYQIVAGERRWRAAQMAQLHELPVILRQFSDGDVLQVALIENIQRADLNAIEEAAAIRQLMERFGHTQEALAEVIHKSRSHVANMLRLLTLPEKVQGWVQEGRLSAGHARALVTAPDAERVAQRVIDGGLSVRETEALMRQSDGGKRKPAIDAGPKDADTRALEADLSAQLDMRVTIAHGASGGTLTVAYRDLEQLDRLCQLLARQG